MTRAMRFFFGVSLVAAIADFVSIVARNPHGGWDAWAVWNLHARFFVSDRPWDLFTPTLWWSHPDYPPLLPGIIVGIWKLTGTQSVTVPAIVAGLFTFGCVGMLLWAIRGWRGYAAATLLLSCHWFIAHGASEYADVPTSFFLLATLTCAERCR